MIRWFQDFLKPREDHFMAYLQQQAQLGVTGLEGLAAYMKSPTRENEERVNQAEKAADEVRRMLIDDLNRTFVTPIDREDLFMLSRTVDDILDYAHSTVEEMIELKIEPNEFLSQMAQLLLDASKEILLALQRLEKHPNVASEHARQAKRIENHIEKAYRRAVGELFSRPAVPEEIVKMLKLREIYRHVSNAGDRADEAANVITDIIVKTT
ncbi:MAG: DUF47 family protein [Oligoflexia bacterium]|nr:DUF47 family protein [Oligoflexia bacterium]